MLAQDFCISFFAILVDIKEQELWEYYCTVLPHMKRQKSFKEFKDEITQRQETTNMKEEDKLNMLDEFLGSTSK